VILSQIRVSIRMSAYRGMIGSCGTKVAFGARRLDAAFLVNTADCARNRVAAIQSVSRTSRRMSRSGKLHRGDC
jgi:hypothetical protein